MTQTKKKECLYCKKTLSVTNKNKKFCSGSCRLMHNLKEIYDFLVIYN